MSELEPGRVKSRLTRDDQLRSNKVLFDLSLHHPDPSAIASLTLAITENFPILPPRPAMNLRQRLRARRAAMDAIMADELPESPPPSIMTFGERRTERRPVHSTDFQVFLDTVATLMDRGKLNNETVDMESLNDSLGQRWDDLRADEKTRFRTRVYGGATAVLAVGVIAGTGIYQQQRADAIAQEQANVLSLEKSAPSYEAEWRISAATPEQGMQFAAYGRPVSVRANERITIQQNGDQVDTEILVLPYQTTSGGTGMKIVVPTGSPFYQDPLFGADLPVRRDSEFVQGQVFLILAAQGYATLTAPDGTTVIINIVDETPKDPTDKSYTVTRIVQVPLPR